MNYPASNTGDWNAYWGASPMRHLRLLWRHVQFSVPNRKNKANLVATAGSFQTLKHDDLPLVFVVRNAAAYIKSFLRYYREMGVTRFIVVDDRSDDGTAEILSGAPDVDLYSSSIRYAEADRGRAWRDALFNLYGAGAGICLSMPTNSSCFQEWNSGISTRLSRNWSRMEFADAWRR